MLADDTIETGSNAPEVIQAGGIVGSGPAGMTVALELEPLGVDCVLLESGSDAERQVRVAEPDTANGHYDGPERGQPIARPRRRRCPLGGLCRRLDAMDLERRAWVPGSGWPIGLADLLPHYDTAHRILELPPAQYNPEDLPSIRADLLQDRDFVNTVFYYDNTPVGSGTDRPQLESSTRIRTFLDATVVDIETDETGQRVAALQVSTLEGKRFRVLAQRFVLAAGAYRPTTMLNANSVHRTGLGNANDMVGRYFLQHPVLYGPRIMMFNARAGKRLRREGEASRSSNGNPAERSEATSPAQLSLFPAAATVAGRREMLLRQLPAPVRRLVQDTPFARVGEVGEVPEFLNDLQSILTPKTNPQTLYATLETRAEQAPNPDSRITLDTDRDQLGLRRAVMDWRLTELDRTSMQAGMSCWPAAWHAMAQDAYSQGRATGTRRLEVNSYTAATTNTERPAGRFTAKQCRRSRLPVHGLANMYIAGSAVFPPPDTPTRH